MKSSNMNARNAVSGSTEFPWKWKLEELDKRPKHGHSVFSCFSCGGGSSMGYKLAGFDVVGNCEIDPDMMKVYKQNNHPKHPFLMDVRDFLKLPDEKIPDELFRLDVLDGSPPCSVFSMAGDRKSGWNVEKTFREGQAKQRLDDLFLFFIAIAVAAHLFWLQINLIDCHRINRYNDISIEKEKVPEHLFFCRDKCSGTIYKHGYYIKIRNRIQ